MMSRVFGGSTPTKKTPEHSAVAQSPTAIDNGGTLAVSPAPATAAASAGPAKALRLVYTDEKGRFRMDAEAVAALQLVKGPIGVVSVCGRARQGKSFILNQLLGRSSGFQVGPTHRPCTKGLWMWSSPLKRIAPDGTEYSLLLLDSEGIDAYDQTGTYSTQIFSLAVLLSSMFVYNQMGGIDEAALDRLSLVTEMTKHIRVRASHNRTTADELGQFSPMFLWLLRDFYLDLNEDGRKITPREYLESALQPMAGSGKAVYAKNEIRESIRALFPDRHCFTLVRPVNSEHDLQRLDLIPMERMRSEFRTGLDNLTRFIFERTRPKQVGSTVLTGPMLAGLTQSFLDAINAGAVPTIATSWQNVEENECRRAYDVGLEVYMTTFDKSTSADESALQEAYDAALQRALAAYSFEAVGVGAIRMKYENQLKMALRRQFEDFKQKAAMEAELKCVKAIESMEERLRAACNSPHATFDQILHLLGELILQYERTISGPAKWRKLVKFIQQSLEGSFNDLVKRTITQASSQASSLELKCRSLEDRLSLTGRQTEAAQREAMDWKRRYEAAIADYKSATELSSSQYAAVQGKLSKLEEKRASLAKQLEAATKEAHEWQSKFEHLQTEQRTDDERYKAEFAALQSRCSAAEARLAASREQSEAAKEEAAEWHRKHDAVLAESRSTAERYNALRERGNKHSQQREDALRAEFNSTISQKDTLLAEAHSKLEQSEHTVTDLKARLQGQEAKLQTREEELASLRVEIRSLATSLQSAKDSAKIHQNEAQFANKEKLYAEDKLKIAVKKLEEAQVAAEMQSREAKRAIEEADRARSGLTLLEKEKLEAMSLAMERLAGIEKAERHAEALKREKEVLAKELAAARSAEQLLSTKMESMEKRLEEREHETEVVLLNAHEQRASTVQVLEGLLASERLAHAEANSRAESLSVQLQSVQAKLDALQQELATSRLNETALETKLRTQAESTGRRKQLEESGGQEIEVTPPTESRGGRRKRPRLDFDNGSSQGDYLEEHGSTELRDSQSQQDYRKFTINKLKQEITKAGFGAQILQMKNAAKRDYLALYEECVLNR